MRTVIINDSSLIRLVEYDPDTAVMTIVFMNGRVYHYNDVVTQDFMLIVGSPSVGAAANAFFKRNKGVENKAVGDAFLEVEQHVLDNLNAWKETL